LGRFGREKNLKTLYQAFRKLTGEYENIHLLLVGGDKELLEAELDSTEHVTVVKPTEFPERYYQAMDIYVLPSLTETTSLTTLEAMSTGLPVVCTSVGSISSYVEHKVNGFIFPPETVERLVLVLKNLINSSALRKKVGAKARKTVIKSHSWKQTAKKIGEIISHFG